jgi:co-chaperonin GroES (HSP10)
MENESGIYPCGNRVLVHADQIEEKYGELIERRISGYSEPFALPGDRISFAKFAGQKYIGKDGKRYLVINDEDITCRLDDEVELSDLKIRKGAGL